MLLLKINRLNEIVEGSIKAGQGDWPLSRSILGSLGFFEINLFNFIY